MLEGEISEIDLVARLVELWREQFTGAIRFENDGIIKIVYFKGGDILSASTNDRSDSIDEILMRAGKVSREHVKQALAKRKESETLGDALLNLGFITRKELTWARRVQVVGVIRSIAAWSAGSFTIVADYLPKRDEGTLFPVPQVLVELVVTDQDRATFERALDGGSAVLAKASDFDEVFRRLGLNDDAEAIAAQIDGVKSAAEVASASHRDTFNAYKLIHALATLGILTRVAGARTAPELVLDDFATAGVADAADMLVEPRPAPVSAPAPPAPRFELDEAEARSQPTLEVPKMSFDDPPSPAPSSAWDEPEEEIAPTPPSQMPAWDSPRPAPAPIPMPVEPRAAAPAWSSPAAPAKTPTGAFAGARAETPAEGMAERIDEQWGFDEAQIETVQSAATARSKTSPPRGKGGRRFGLLIALMVIFLLAVAGYFGFLWWQARDATEVAPVVVNRPKRKTPPPAPAPETLTATETTATGTLPATPTETVATTAPATTTAATTTLAQKPPPMQITAPKITAPAQAPAPATSQALPAVVPKQGGNRYDSMARQYAANPSGNFTVQIQILCETSNLDKAISTGGANIWFVPQALGTRSCYRVFWGHFGTRDEAEKALATTIPQSLRDRSSAVKPVPK
jgi:hypothetical protein